MRSRRTACACALLMLMAAAVPAFAAQKEKDDKAGPRQTPFAEVMRASWYSINERLIAAAEKMPKEHYAFRPVKEVRTFGEILGHVALDRYSACSPVIGRATPSLKLGDIESKDQFVELLRESAAVCDMAIGLLSDETAGFRYRAFNGEYTRAALLMATILHDSEHYGNIVTYLRLKNVVPPATAGMR